jgi:hypothetical protein
MCLPDDLVDGALRLDEHGKLQLPPLEKAVPEQAEYHSRRMSAFLPRNPLADLLLEVDNWTGFLRHLIHLSTGMATTGRERLILVAGLVGMGMNYGLSKWRIPVPTTIVNFPGRWTGISARGLCLPPLQRLTTFC